MRILLVSDEGLGAGGIGTSVVSLARGLGMAGHDVVLVWPAPAVPLPIEGVRQVPVRSSRWTVGRLGFLELAGPPRAGALPEAWAPDVIHAMRATPLGLWAWWRARVWRVPFVLSKHEIVEQTPAENAGGRALRGLAATWFRLAYRLADLTVTPTRFVANYALGRLGLRRRPRVLTNAVDLDWFRTAAGHPDLASLRARSRASRPQDVRVCAVINLSPYKNPQMLLDLWAGLRDRGVPARLDVAGGGVMFRELGARIEQLGLNERVRLLGPLDRAGVARLIGSSDALILTSRAEVQGIVLLEAKALGVAALVAEAEFSGAAGEVVDDQDGLLFPVDDLPEAVERLAAVLCDPERLRRLGEGALASAERYGLLPVARQAERLYGAAIGRSRRLRRRRPASR